MTKAGLRPQSICCALYCVHFPLEAVKVDLCVRLLLCFVITEIQCSGLPQPAPRILALDLPPQSAGDVQRGESVEQTLVDFF